MSDWLPAALRWTAALLATGGAVALVAASRNLSVQGSRHVPVIRGRGGWPALRGLLAQLNRKWVPPIVLVRLESAARQADQKATADELVVWMELCAAGGLGAGIAVCVWLELRPFVPLAFSAAGALLPPLWLRDKVRARQRAMLRALPFDLDLLTLSVEAGLDFAAALAKVTERGRKGPLADELSVVLKELRLGKTRDEALRNLAARVRLPALTSFVHALVQADRMGTPLGKVLRILSTQMRIERTQRAEKLANEAPVKLLFPLICFIFPTLFLMLFGPIAYQMIFGGMF
jgi:tight adherence protein C